MLFASLFFVRFAVLCLLFLVLCFLFASLFFVVCFLLFVVSNPARRMESPCRRILSPGCCMLLNEWRMESPVGGFHLRGVAGEFPSCDSRWKPPCWPTQILRGGWNLLSEDSISGVLPGSFHPAIGDGNLLVGFAVPCSLFFVSQSLTQSKIVFYHSVRLWYAMRRAYIYLKTQ